MFWFWKAPPPKKKKIDIKSLGFSLELVVGQNPRLLVKTYWDVDITYKKILILHAILGVIHCSFSMQNCIF